MDEDLIAEVFRQNKAFFDLPVEEKTKILADDNFRGYTPMKVSNEQGHRDGKKFKRCFSSSPSIFLLLLLSLQEETLDPSQKSPGEYVLHSHFLSAPCMSDLTAEG